MKKETREKLERLIKLNDRLECLEDHLNKSQVTYYNYYIANLKEITRLTCEDENLVQKYNESLKEMGIKVAEYINTITNSTFDIDDASRAHSVKTALLNLQDSITSRQTIQCRLDPNDFRKGKAGFREMKETLDFISSKFRQEYLKRVPEFIEKCEQEIEELISNKTITNTEVINVGPYNRALEFYQFKKESETKFTKTWKNLEVTIKLLGNYDIELEIHKYKDVNLSVSVIIKEEELIQGALAEILSVIGNKSVNISTARSILANYSKFAVSKLIGEKISKF